MIRKAMLYVTEEHDRVRCDLCAHRCRIAPAQRGICGVRENRDGALYTLVYGEVIAEHIDPIEKKPLFHVMPGSQSLSVATVGCNFQCTFCQNHDISQMPRITGRIMGQERTPEDIVSRALSTGCRSIAYTYTEPTIFFEYAYDIATLAHDRGIKNIFVTNGYQTPDAIDTIAPILDAANVDLKAYQDSFYKEFCGARLLPVLEALKRLKEQNVWLEVTTLIIPTLNDSDAELRDIARFIAALGTETPWHISRFHPQYEMTNLPPTPIATIHRAAEIGREEGLLYVYSGNVPGDNGEKTRCPGCGTLLIDRYGFSVNGMNLTDGSCPSCGRKIEGIL